MTESKYNPSVSKNILDYLVVIFSGLYQQLKSYEHELLPEFNQVATSVHFHRWKNIVHELGLTAVSISDHFNYEEYTVLVLAPLTTKSEAIFFLIYSFPIMGIL